MRVRKAVFPAAGWGTRFLPATKAQPKEMLPLVDKPVIQYAVEEAVAAGIEQVIIVTSSQKRAIEDHFDLNYELEHLLEEKGEIEKLRQVRHISDLAQIAYVRQKEQLGLGHAVLMAKDLIGHEPFAVILPDDVVVADRPCIGQLIDAYHQHHGSVVAVMEVPPEDTPRYGIIAGCKQHCAAGHIDASQGLRSKRNQRAHRRLAPAFVASLNCAGIRTTVTGRGVAIVASFNARNHAAIATSDFAAHNLEGVLRDDCIIAEFNNM